MFKCYNFMMIKSKKNSHIKLKNNSFHDINTIDDINEKSFFTTKKIIVFALFFLLTLTLFACTVIFVFKTNIFSLMMQIRFGLITKEKRIWFLLLILYFLITPIFNVISLWIRVRRIVKISFIQWFCLMITIDFIKAITPANFVYDPYTIFWMKVNGVPIQKAVTIMFINVWQWQLTQILITVPSFIIIAKHGYKMLTNQLNISIFSLMIIGLSIDIIGLIITTLLCLSTNVHYFLSRILNWFKKKFKLKYHTKGEIIEIYKKQKVMRKDFYEHISDYSSTILTFIFVLLEEIYVYSATYFAFAFFLPQGVEINFMSIFNVANVAYTANKMIPLPGGELSTQLIMKQLFDVYGGIKNCSPNEKEGYIANSILLWKWFSSYLVAFFGFFGFLYLTFDQIKNKNRKC